MITIVLKGLDSIVISFFPRFLVASDYVRPGGHDFGAFSLSFQVQVRVPGSNFTSQTDTPKPISNCSIRRAESNGANIFRI